MKNEVVYEPNGNLFSKSYVLKNRTNLLNESGSIEKVNIQEEAKSLTGISDLFRFKSILGGLTGKSIEFDYMVPFGDFNVPRSGGPNDLDFIIDFWYDEPEIFNEENDYRELLLNVTNNFEYLKNFRYRSRSTNPGRKKSIVIWCYRGLGVISSQLILHIEKELGKPNFSISIEHLVNRLKKQNREALPIELAQAMLQLTSGQDIFTWPEKITDRVALKFLDSHYSQ